MGTADLTPYGGRNIEEYYNKVGNTIDNMLREKHKSSLDPKKFTKRVKGKHDSWRMFEDKQDLQVYKLDEEKITQVLDSNWKEKARNIVRVKAGLPKVGEGYKNETKLKRTIEGLLEPTGYEVKHHASPSWLGRQHLDIYIPEINLAVEYMGQQHYESLDFFGGEDRYKETKQRDKEKKTKCKKNNVKLIRYKYDEPIDPQKIAEKICNKSNLEIQKLDLNTEVPSDEELPTY